MKHTIFGVKSEWLSGEQKEDFSFEWYFECGLCYCVKASRANLIFMEAEGHVAREHGVDAVARVG